MEPLLSPYPLLFRVFLAILAPLFLTISSVPASSLKAERSFSAAGCFVTKLKTILQDGRTGTLCFLRLFLAIDG